MADDELYDIYYIREAPKALKRQDLSAVIKIVVIKHEHSQDNTIAIDVEKNGIYIDPRVSALGISATEGMEVIDDVEEAIHILEKHNVQDWKEDYSTEDPKSYQDGVGWNVWLQYKDGTVERHKGSGSGLDNITPEGFGDFFNELQAFVDERMEDGE